MAIVATQNGVRLKFLVTITAGTPILLVGGTEPVKCDRLSVEPLIGGTGAIYVYDDLPLQTPAAPVQVLPANVAASCGPPRQLAPATSTLPGTVFDENPAQDPYNYLDLRSYSIDGSHTGDTAMVDARLKV